jgi:hypothetical protein
MEVYPTERGQERGDGYIDPTGTAERSDNNIERYPLPERPANWNPAEIVQVGLRGATYSYFRSDEASSAAQKAVRRGRDDEAVQWFLELFWMSAAARTNIWNRALVMAIEDAGPANVWLVGQIWNLVVNAKDQPVAIAIAAILLARSTKSRVNDWAVKLIPQLKDPAIADMIGSPTSVQAMLIRGLQDRNTGVCLFMVKTLVYTTHKITGKYKNAQWLIWLAFDQIIGSDPDHVQYLQILKEIGMSSTWRWANKCRLLHIHAIHLWCNDRWPTSSQRPDLTIDNTIQHDANLATQRVYRREGLVGIPDYAVDKHTQRGKSLGRGLEHFIQVGSILHNVDPEWEPLSRWYLSDISV